LTLANFAPSEAVQKAASDDRIASSQEFLAMTMSRLPFNPASVID
jgi:hypothetical protein